MPYSESHECDYNIKKLFGARVKTLRTRKNMTQSNVAEYVDVDSKHISCIESGKNFPSAELVGRLAKALEVHPYKLFEFENSPTSEELRKQIIKIVETAKDCEIEKIFIYSKFITAT